MRVLAPTDRQAGNMLHFLREAFERARTEGRTKDMTDANEAYLLLVAAPHVPEEA